MPTVCALIPTYNRADLLIACLESILAQTRLPDDILVIDDGSSDDTKTRITPYLDRVRYIRQEHQGKAAALNYGLTQSNADLIWICDDDDLAAPDGLEQLCTPFKDAEAPDYSFGRYQTFTGTHPTDKHAVLPEFSRRPEEPNVKLNFLEDMFILQFGLLVKKSVYDAVGPFQEDLLRSQDYEMMLRISRHYTGAFVDSVIFYKREHEAPRAGLPANAYYKDISARWMYYDQMFFPRIARDYTWKEFTPTFARDWSLSLQKRASYIEKGLILAKRALWEDAIKSWTQALDCDAPPLSEEEHHLCAHLIQNAQSWMFLSRDPEAIGHLRALYQKNQQGQALVYTLLRPLRWMSKSSLKQGQLKQLFTLIYLACKILGPLTAMRRFLYRNP